MFAHSGGYALWERNWGRIIFISSESALVTPGEMIHYGMTKTAQLAVSRGLAGLTKGTKVTVNSVLPGPTRSEGIIDFLKSIASDPEAPPEQIEAEFFAKARPSSLLQRMIEPDEIANLVAYVASPLSSATNGAALRVDGGVTPRSVKSGMSKERMLQRVNSSPRRTQLCGRSGALYLF